MRRHGKQGGNTSSVEVSPRKRSQMAARRARQEKRWAAKSGPVETLKVERCECGEWNRPGHVCRT